MAADHGYDIDPDDDDFVAMCDCKPVCSTYLCTGCKERKPFCSTSDRDPDLCDECWEDEQSMRCGCSDWGCPCDGLKTGYMGG